MLATLVSVVTTLGIVIILFSESSGFFREVPLKDFLFGDRWAPLLHPKSFGVLPLLTGTLMIVFGASLISIPIGLTTAIYLNEYSTERFRRIVKPVMEILAGVPTIVYGYFALTFITPIMQRILPQTHIFNAASASIVVGVMILPMVASLCDDAINAVPKSLKEAGFSMGAIRFEVVSQITLPAAFSGITAAFVLAVSRAIGETMAVTLAAGATPGMGINYLDSIQTMTAYIVQVSLGDTPAGGIEYKTIFAVGSLLFIITLVMNIIAGRIMNHFREVYD